MCTSHHPSMAQPLISRDAHRFCSITLIIASSLVARMILSFIRQLLRRGTPCECDTTQLNTVGVTHSAKEASSYNRTETVTAQPLTGTPNEHVRVDVTVRVFDSPNQRLESQHYTSNAHTTPTLQQQPAPSQLALANQPPPNEARDQPHENVRIPIDEPHGRKATHTFAVSEPRAHKMQPQEPTSGNTEWDVWPDGHIVRTYSHEDAKRPEVNDFHVHWACEGVGAPRKQHKGSLDALQWQDGVRSRRRCHGVIICTNHESKGGSCAIVIRPTTTKKLITRQLETTCSCGAMLVHNNCGIIYDLFKFAGGDELLKIWEVELDILCATGASHSTARETRSGRAFNAYMTLGRSSAGTCQSVKTISTSLVGSLSEYRCEGGFKIVEGGTTTLVEKRTVEERGKANKECACRGMRVGTTHLGGLRAQDQDKN
ncbi:hypothetical protein DEU56DRAFT_899764 [Suillus clintonianus]|uniref:uncharacterized protein n=1 Tax=Suillus clintonianus TaxID=1904413 RepID=UPI001B86ECA1|nr:uncharacterized protein DEU56DRAFT_899764 [Suillus clintonianus]KAG2146343.1 hypothetical protein DEU56DRAFT_899764 [Suillus clintonianus]